jgi:hypothetical protein
MGQDERIDLEKARADERVRRLVDALETPRDEEAEAGSGAAGFTPAFPASGAKNW